MGGGGSSRNFPGSIFSGGGGGVVAEIFCARFGWERGRWQNFFRNRPSIRVIQPFIVFCPNNVHSLSDFMSTNCPNWGGGQLPPLPPVPYAYGCQNASLFYTTADLEWFGYCSVVGDCSPSCCYGMRISHSVVSGDSQFSPVD